MSFGLSVYAPRFPDDLATVWQDSLLPHGLVVEVLPDFSPGAWRGGFLPFKVTVAPGAFKAADRYGRDSLLAGFEIAFRSENSADLEEFAAEASPEAAAIYRKSRHSAYLGSSMGRSVADLRLQCFAAATLAIAASGLVSDGQRGEDFLGEAAIQNAAREADEYESSSGAPEDWDLTPFPGWAALEPPS